MTPALRYEDVDGGKLIEIMAPPISFSPTAVCLVAGAIAVVVWCVVRLHDVIDTLQTVLPLLYAWTAQHHAAPDEPAPPNDAAHAPDAPQTQEEQARAQEKPPPTQTNIGEDDGEIKNDHETNGK